MRLYKTWVIRIRVKMRGFVRDTLVLKITIDYHSKDHKRTYSMICIVYFFIKAVTFKCILQQSFTAIYIDSLIVINKQEITNYYDNN
jgi:hypothetical protein